jgi:hypothetical protein
MVSKFAVNGWGGVNVRRYDGVLKNLRLKTNALNALNLPFKVQSGVVGKLSLQVPWRNLGRAPVVANIDELFLVAGFAEPDEELTVEERTARFEAAQAELKRRLVDEGELAWLTSGDGKAGSKNDDDAAGAADAAAAAEGGDGWLAGLLDTILGNLVVQVSRIHLRLEGDLGTPTTGPDPFAAGVTLQSLEVQSVDETGKVAFQVKGLAERMRKSAVLTRLAAYFDVGAQSLCPAGREWGDLTAAEFVAVMDPGTSSEAAVSSGAGARRRELRAARQARAPQRRDSRTAGAPARRRRRRARDVLAPPRGFHHRRAAGTRRAPRAARALTPVRQRARQGGRSRVVGLRVRRRSPQAPRRRSRRRRRAAHAQPRPRDDARAQDVRGCVRAPRASHAAPQPRKGQKGGG